MKRYKRFIIKMSFILTLAIIVGACAVYFGDYYRADMDAIEAFSVTSEVEYKKLDNDSIIFEPDGATKGLIFYPGGKVEYTAYIPLMQACAEQGIMCVLLEMPFNLAVFDVNAADSIQKKYPEIEEWYIGGHSLGGSMAASYLGNNAEDYEGLILLGSYAATDLSDTDIDVLLIYGSEDEVMNRENYEKNKLNLPDDFTEIVIDGGCHAYFGMYGAQDGDGTPAITNEEQISLTVEHVVEIMECEYKKY